MSFILDALKKSETERQHKGSAEFANVPTSDDRREGPPAWLWVLGVLLLINLAVLIGIFLRPDAGTPEPIAASAPAAGPSEPAPAAEAKDVAPPREDFASRVATARENAPVVEQPSPPVEDEPVFA